ncbi:hypothetical protein AVP3_0057 [Aeromonas phage AVP3]
MAHLTIKRPDRMRDRTVLPPPVVEQDSVVFGAFFGDCDIYAYSRDGRSDGEPLRCEDDGRLLVPEGCSLHLQLGWELVPEDGAVVMLVAHESLSEMQVGLLLDNLPLVYYARKGFEPYLILTNRTGSDWYIAEGEPLVRALIMKPNPLTVTIQETKL